MQYIPIFHAAEYVRGNDIVYAARQVTIRYYQKVERYKREGRPPPEKDAYVARCEYLASNVSKNARNHLLPTSCCICGATVYRSVDWMRMSHRRGRGAYCHPCKYRKRS